MPRFGAPMERRLEGLEEEYGMTPGRERKEEGLFGPRGFWGNVRDFYGMDSWGDSWRNLFGRSQREPLGRMREEGRERGYMISPRWGKENIREHIDIMERRD